MVVTLARHRRLYGPDETMLEEDISEEFQRTPEARSPVPIEVGDAENVAVLLARARAPRPRKGAKGSTG